MGLGLLGRGVGVTKFLAECGANVLVTDLKSADELAPSLEQLREYDNIEYVLGEHRKEDFRTCDMVIRASNVPKGNEYVREARAHDIPVTQDAALFAKLAPDGVTLVGITGTRGKSTVTHLIHHILTEADKTAHLGGNVRGMATLPLLHQIEPGDYAILELDSWQLQSFGTAQISPHIAVFTNFMPDHQNYYRSMEEYFDDKSHIFRYQSRDDFLVTSPEGLEAIRTYFDGEIQSTVAVARAQSIPESWELHIPGEHNRANAALAVQVAELLEVPTDVIRAAVASFSGVEGRLQYLGMVDGIHVYNDNNATTPEATIAGLKAIAGRHTGPVTLLVGGADKGLELDELTDAVVEYADSVVLLAGTGTDQIRFKLYPHDGRITIKEADDLEAAVEESFLLTPDGGTLLFSPAFASFGLFANEYERNDRFLELIDSSRKNV